MRASWGWVQISQSTPNPEALPHAKIIGCMSPRPQPLWSVQLASAAGMPAEPGDRSDTPQTRTVTETETVA
jgi:hypothetical protein